MTRRPSGRPRTVAQRRKGLPIYLTPDELAAVDAARGTQDRSAWIRDAIKERLQRGTNGTQTDLY